jgi:glycosyltransferase involved in cell wall biosynthesis
MSTNYKLAVIAITIGKYQGLKTLLDSIESQAVKADLVIIVDANKHYSEERLGKYSFPVRYIHTGPNSLTEARNIGIKNVPGDFDLICFLDDDIVLCENALTNMHSFWRNASKDTGGDAFNVINFPVIPRMKTKELFVLDSLEKGKVLKSGFGSSLYPIAEDLKTQWLSGGNSVWRRALFSDYRFDEKLKGYGFVDDLDFSYQVGKKYKLYVLANACLEHFSATSNRKSIFRYGLLEVTSRYYFLCKHRELSSIMFYWAYSGLIINGFLSSIMRLNFNYFKRACGNLCGVFYTLLLKDRAINN